MDSARPFYRQISGKLFLLTCTFLSVLAASVYSYYLQSQQLSRLTEQQLPQVSQSNQRQSALIKHYMLMQEMLMSRQVSLLVSQYEALTLSLSNSSVLSRRNRALFEQLIKEQQAQKDSISRLEENYRRNNQLRENAIIQLTIVMDNLNDQIKIQSRQQGILERQIKSDKLTDRVTALRAKALSAITIQLNQNQRLYRQLAQTRILFEEVDLQYNVWLFDAMHRQTRDDITQWLENVVLRRDDGATDKALTNHVKELDAFLFATLNVFAKWRGQLRIASEYRDVLIQQQQLLLPLLTKVPVVSNVVTQSLEQQIIQQLAQFDINITRTQLYWLILAVIGLLVFIFIMTTWSVKRKLQRLGQASIEVVEHFVNGEASAKQAPSEEMATITKLLDTVTRPEHSEKQYQQQQKAFQHSLHCLGQHNKLAYWRLPNVPEDSQEQVLTLLSVTSLSRHWRHHFSIETVNEIVRLARCALQENRIQRLNVTTKNGQHISLTLEKDSEGWFGTISSAEQYAQLQTQQDAIVQEAKDYRQYSTTAIIQHNDGLSQHIVQLMLDSQLQSIEQVSDKSAQYQRLNVLQQQIEQSRVAASFAHLGFRLEHSSVNIVSEIYGAIQNMKQVAAISASRIDVNLDSHLVENVTIDVVLFQQLLSVIARTLLQNQQSSVLTLSVNVADKANAQQVIRLNFELNHAQTNSAIKTLVEQFALMVDNNEVIAFKPVEYLSGLMSMLNASSYESVLRDDGAKICVELPVATLAQKAERDEIDLASHNILVLAADALIGQKISHILQVAQVKPEVLKDASLFKRQLSVKHQNAKKVDLVILSPETYLSDYDAVRQHIASLPNQLQPKLLVIQPEFNTPMYRTGLFSLHDSPCLAYELNRQVDALLTGSEKNNLVIAGEVLAQYRHGVSQVEVLVAVKAPQENQLLLRLLQWFGLQVTVVSQLKTQEAYWRSGKYLVLMSEFQSTSLTVETGKDITRGVFACNSLTTIDDKGNLPSSWVVGSLPSTLDIAALNACLLPWLKPSKTRTLLASSSDEQNKEHSASREKDCNEFLTDELLPTLAELEANAEPNDYLDLAKFAQNQGSIELAAFMLDDYISDINKQLDIMNTVIEVFDKAKLVKTTNQVLTLTKIIAAKSFEQCCQQLAGDLVEHQQDILLADDKALLWRYYDEMRDQCLQLVQFSEAI